MLPLDEIVRRSYKHCHVHGLYGLVLEDHGDRLTRMFYTAQTHRLLDTRRPMPLAIHGHRNDLTLRLLLGEMTNRRYQFSSAGAELDRFKFTSAILNGKKNARFEHVGSSDLALLDEDYLRNRGDFVFMRGEELHTVWVPEGMESAWLVEEGDRTETHDDSSWSNDDLTKFPFEQHYHPVTHDEVVEILTKCGLLKFGLGA